MRDVHILQELLTQQCPEIHKKRLTSLMVATSALLEGDTLSLTALGRSINGAASAKHSSTPWTVGAVSLACKQPVRTQSHAGHPHRLV